MGAKPTNATTTKTKALVVLPVRGGAQIAFPWRIWVGGNEVYVAKRSEQQLVGPNAKASFHTGGESALKLGSMRKQLQRGFPLPAGWEHLLALHFVVVPDASRPDPVRYEDLVPPDSKTKRLFVMNCPAGLVLRLDIAVTRRRNDKPCPTLGEQGAELLAEMSLRNGGSVVTTARWFPLTEHSYQVTLRNVVHEAAAFRFKQQAQKENYYFEFDIRHESEVHGNHFSVYPIAWPWVAPAPALPLA